MKTVFSLIAAALATAALPGAASAAEFLYTLTPLSAGGYSARWRMAVNPDPTQAVSGEGFAIERVAGSFPRTTDGDAYLDFYVAGNGGGLMISDADGTRVLETLSGPQLYTGSEEAPTMLRGTFALTSTKAGRRRYALTVTDAPGAVPEPATWLLSIAGFGMVGAAMRRPDRVAVRSA